MFVKSPWCNVNLQKRVWFRGSGREFNIKPVTTRAAKGIFTGPKCRHLWLFWLILYKTWRIRIQTIPFEILDHCWKFAKICAEKFLVISNLLQIEMSETDKINVDSIISRLLEVRGSRPGKAVQLTEAEIRGLCLKVPLFTNIFYKIHQMFCLVPRGFPISANPTGTRGSAQNLWRRARPVLRFTQIIRIWKLSSWVKLFISWRLRWQGKTVARNNLLITSI